MQPHNAIPGCEAGLAGATARELLVPDTTCQMSISLDGFVAGPNNLVNP